MILDGSDWAGEGAHHFHVFSPFRGGIRKKKGGRQISGGESAPTRRSFSSTLSRSVLAVELAAQVQEHTRGCGPSVRAQHLSESRQCEVKYKS